MSKEIETNWPLAGPKIVQLRKALSPGLSEQIRSLQSSEALSNTEVVLRFASLLIVGQVMSIVTASWLYGLWSATYVAMAALYMFLLQRTPHPVTRARYLIVMVLNLAGVWIYTSFAIYIWLVSDNMAIQMVAVAALIGHIIFNTTRHTLLSWLVIVDILTVVVAIAFVAFMLSLSLKAPSEKVMVALGALALAIYYSHAHVQQILERADLARRRREAMERQKDSAIGQITAGVAHDFNNILTAIQGNVELAELTQDTDDRAELLHEARKSTRRASDIVAQLMAYVGKSHLNAENLPLDRLSRDIRAALKDIVPPSMRLKLTLDTRNLTVAADRSNLIVALRHLVQNAVDASTDGSGHVHLTIAALDPNQWPHALPKPDRPYTLFTVRDDGPGMPEQNLRLATDPFFTTKPKGGGAGLGLAMVRGFAKQSGGSLRLRNTDAGGLEAALILPSRVNKNDE